MRKLLTSVVVALLSVNTAYSAVPDALEALGRGKYKEAFDELSLLSGNGNPEATYQLGKLYEEGTGIPVNLNRAYALYDSAAQAGNVDAAYRKAMMMMEGRGVARNFELAFHLLKKVAREKHAEALYALGELYGSGKELKRDYTYAYGFYHMSALEGYAPAQYKLAILYLYGRGIPQDYQRALKWFSRSASQGYVSAQRDLAELLATDEILLNLTEAYGWYNIIAAYNSDDIGEWAVLRRNEISKKVQDPQELIRAQEMARRWKPKDAKETVPQVEYEAARPVIPGFNDEQTLAEIQDSTEYLFREAERYTLTYDEVKHAVFSKDLTALETKAEQIAQTGKISVYNYIGDLYVKMLKDPVKAFDWYYKGAKAGESTAQTKAAAYFCEGKKPASVNLTECAKWLTLAEEEAGLSVRVQIQQALEKVNEMLTDADKKEVAAKVAEIKKAKEANKSVLKSLFN